MYRFVIEDPYERICTLLKENIATNKKGFEVLPISEDPRFTELFKKFCRQFHIMYKRHPDLKAAYIKWHHSKFPLNKLTVTAKKIDTYVDSVKNP